MPCCQIEFDAEASHCHRWSAGAGQDAQPLSRDAAQSIEINIQHRYTSGRYAGVGMPSATRYSVQPEVSRAPELNRPQRMMEMSTDAESRLKVFDYLGDQATSVELSVIAPPDTGGSGMGGKNVNAARGPG